MNLKKKLIKQIKELEEEKLEIINERNEINNKKYEYETEIKKLNEELETQNSKNKDIQKELEKELENYKEINNKMLVLYSYQHQMKEVKEKNKTYKQHYELLQKKDELVINKSTKEFEALIEEKKNNK